MDMFYSHDLDWNYGDATFQLDYDLFWKLADEVAESWKSQYSQPVFERRYAEYIETRDAIQNSDIAVHVVQEVFEDYLVTRKVINDSYAEGRSAYPFWGRGTQIEERFQGLALSNARQYVRFHLEKDFSKIEVMFDVLDDLYLIESVFANAWYPEEDEDDAE